MRTYLIGYDLNKTGQNYKDLIEKIKATFTYWWHHLDSTWIVKSNLTAAQIRDLLKPFIDSNDELLVAGLTGESAWTGFDERGSKWLRENIQPS
jgi:hypothetical protein